MKRLMEKMYILNSATFIWIQQMIEVRTLKKLVVSKKILKMWLLELYREYPKITIIFLKVNSHH